MFYHRTTTYTQRIAIVEGHQSGHTYHELASQFGLNYYTVRKWCRAFRDADWEALTPPNKRKHGRLSRFHPLVGYVALRLKRQYPGWGLDKILLEMSRRPSLYGLKLPCRSSLHGYYQQFQPRLQRHRPARVQRPVYEASVQAVHDCWQMDFKGETPVGPVGKVKPFMVCDAFSSAPLATLIHSGQRGVICTQDVQDNLRAVFSEWGLPKSIRMDRDPVFVGSSRQDFPGRIVLWLIGLGIAPLVNRAHRPTDNAQVERCNGIWLEHVARGQRYQTLDQVQRSTDQARYDRLAYLPSRNQHCRLQPPLVALPELRQVRIPYTYHDEPQLFDIDRVYYDLSRWVWSRTVDCSGQISLGGSNCRIGYAFSGQLVKVHFDLERSEFVALSLQGHVLKHFTLPSITPEAICGTGMME